MKARRLNVIGDRASRPVRVCLIKPPTVTAPNTLSYYGAVPPLGLAYVAAFTRAEGHELTVVDATGEALDRFERRETGVGPVLWQGLSLEECVARIPTGTEVIGLTNTFLHEWPMLRALLTLIRRDHPDALIVVGGENATAFGREMLERSPGLDVVVRGEGEDVFAALLAAVGAGDDPGDVPGLTLRRGEEIVETPAAPRITSLDDLPRPAWDLFPVSAYLAGRHQSGVDRGRSMPVLTSRGCPYRCTFCSSPTMWTTRYVRRDPDDVVDEVIELVRAYGVDNVDVNDLTAMLTKDWMIELSDAIARRGLDVSWQFPSGTRSEAIDEEAARALFDAGCRNFTYAPESGSKRVLDQMKKKVDLDSLRASLRAASRVGMKTHVSIILGMPDEELRDILASLRLALNLVGDGAHTLSVMIFSPYPGSAQYERLRREGLVDVDDERWIYGSLLRSRGGGSYNRRLPRRALAGLQLTLLGAFFGWQAIRRPDRLASSLSNVLRGRQESVLDQLIHTKTRQLRWVVRAARPSTTKPQPRSSPSTMDAMRVPASPSP